MQAQAFQITGESVSITKQQQQQLRSELPTSFRDVIVALKECGRFKDLSRGLKLHSQAIASGLSCNPYVATSLINMYAKCGSMAEARKVFDNLHFRNVVAWTCLITGYADNGENELALKLFDAMKEEDGGGCVPDARTFVAALSACAALASADSNPSRWLAKGQALHSQAVENSCCNKFVESRLIETYAKCGSMIKARRVFDGMLQRDVVCWTALLQGYVDNGESVLALEVFDKMEETGCCDLDPGIYVTALSACASLAEENDSCNRRWFFKGKSVHAGAVINDCYDSFVECTLVNLYAKFGSMVLARVIFDGMISCDLATWNALVLGYVDNSENEMALEMVAEMEASTGAARNPLTFAAALMACGNLMAVEVGRGFHREIQSCGLEQEIVVANCLVDFYGKCGSMEAAKQVFDSIPRKTIVSWTSLMCGYSLRGDTDSVFEAFEAMLRGDDGDRGVAANEVTFVCLLSACSHSGLTERGKEMFDAMESGYGVRRSIKHYNCMVDLLGRAGFVEEAMEVVRTMPFRPNVVTWTAILGACHKWNNLSLGKFAYHRLVMMDERDAAAASVLMANTFRSSSSTSLSSQALWVDETGKVHKFVEISRHC